MKFINKQAFNKTLSGGETVVYLPKADIQIRAFTVHNPTSDNIDLTLTISNKDYLKKTITAGATEILSQFFNQQLQKDEPLSMNGDNLNVLLTVVEIIE